MKSRRFLERQLSKVRVAIFLLESPKSMPQSLQQEQNIEQRLEQCSFQ